MLLLNFSVESFAQEGLSVSNWHQLQSGNNLLFPQNYETSGQFLMFYPEVLEEILIIPASMPPSSIVEEKHRLTSIISSDIESGTYERAYRRLRNKQGAWNRLYFTSRRYLPDNDRREVLNFYIQQLREKGQDDWVEQIQKQEQDDYYNAMISQLRYWYFLIDSLRRTRKDDVLFSNIWQEFELLGRNVDKLLVDDDIIPELLLYEEIILYTKPFCLPVPEYFDLKK